jgi:hypothetical protein
MPSRLGEQRGKTRTALRILARLCTMRPVKFQRNRLASAAADAAC